jgi:hypothetical protein
MNNTALKMRSPCLTQHRVPKVAHDIYLTAPCVDIRDFRDRDRLHAPPI